VSTKGSKRMDNDEELRAALLSALRRAEAWLPPAGEPVDFAADRAAIWRRGPRGGRLAARSTLDDIELDDLLGIDDQKARLERNTRQFVRGLPANNVLLWGSRGTGKSSLIHALLNRYAGEGLRLVEVDKQALAALPDIVASVADAPYRFIVFCDDLSFEADDPSYKALKSVLDGSVFATGDNVVIYATSNRRHLIPEYHAENLEARHTTAPEGEIHHGESVEEKISLSERFGLWVSFYPFRQDAYLEIVRYWVAAFARRYGVTVEWDEALRAEALRWALARGSRSGRTANQFARDWVGSSALDPPRGAL